MSQTTVLIVDDHSVVIEGIKFALHDQVDFKLIGEANNGKDALATVKQFNPGIVILDISMPDMTGIEVTRYIKKHHPETQIVIYTMYSNKEFVIDLFKAGISAYVLKDDPLSDLLLALQAVRSGGTYFSTKAPTILLRHMQELEKKTTPSGGLGSLSRREMEVFKLLAEGKSIKDISRQLFISPKTVETHKYNILDKLNAASVVELTKLAIRKNLIDA